jgi:hypothetical protein
MTQRAFTAEPQRTQSCAEECNAFSAFLCALCASAVKEICEQP